MNEKNKVTVKLNKEDVVGCETLCIVHSLSLALKELGVFNVDVKNFFESEKHLEFDVVKVNA